MSDQQYFQSADRECSLQIVNVKNYNCTSLTPRKKINENNIPWKFQKIKRIPPTMQSPRKPDNKNISFQTDYLEEVSDQGADDNSVDFGSNFGEKYRGCQRVYRKQRALGTSWLGHRQYFSSIFVDPAVLAKPDKQIFKKKKVSVQQSTQPFTFNSDFQSGNLFASYKISKNEFDLILQNDINTKGNTQWFYFQICNIPSKTKIKFNIVNLLKSDSLFNYGMQPCVFSVEASKRNGQGWFRTGTAIRYYKNQNKVDGSNRYYYTLTFTLMTPFQGDTLRIAHSYPYTIEDLNNFLESVEKKPGRKSYVKRQSIGQTIGKKDIQILKILQQNPRRKGLRPLIFITARQHPGETPSSYACQGFLDFITSDQKQASFLRKNYEIHVLPMLNPDGVEIGNYRTNLCGVDLNRRWDGSKSQLATQTIMVKKYLIETSRNREVAFMIDLHGHSRKLFSFFYGNFNLENPVQVRMFPYICAKSSQGMIRFQDSTFVCEEEKKKTARVQMASKFKTTNVFTFQISFFGYMNKNKQRIHFTQQKIKYLGVILAKSIFLHQRYKTAGQSLQAMSVRKFYQQLSTRPQLIKYGQKICSGSQTQPQKNEVNQSQLTNLEQKNKQQQNSDKKTKNSIKLPKKQSQTRDITKQSRQLHVMDIARVNSIFPNDVLALMPSSLISKNKEKERERDRDKSKRDKNSVAIQTQDVPIIKIYDICRIQEIRQQRQNSIRKKIGIKNQKPENQNALTSRSNLFRTVIRPKSSSNSYLQPNLFPVGSKPETRKRHESGIELKQKRQKQKTKLTTSTQTTITFPPDTDFMAKNLDSLIISPASKALQLIKKKSNFATISPQISSASKTSTQSFKIGLRALNVETWRIKKKNFQ